MAHIEHTTEIDAAPEAVFDVLTDLDRLPDWSTVTVSTHDAPPKPLSAGQTFRQTLRVLGRNLDVDWEVKEVQRPNRLAYEATAPGGGRLRMTQQVRQAGDGSRVELDIDYDLPGGFVGEWLDEHYAERRNEREVEHSLHNLKELVEASTRT